MSMVTTESGTALAWACDVVLVERQWRYDGSMQRDWVFADAISRR
jgi:hypothetical protein